MFGQQNVLRKTPELFNSKRTNLISTSIIIGSIMYAVGIIYFGIQYSWIISVITALLMIFFCGFIFIILPPLYSLSPLWPVVLTAALVVEILS